MIREYAYGGVVFNEDGKVLLRSPTGNWGGYVWTFAKGGADLDETPEETALREVLEETGYRCCIIVPIPGEFESDTCITKYFLMRSIELVTDHDNETEEVRWVSVKEANDMIDQTKTIKGRKRDKSVLESAIKIRKL